MTSALPRRLLLAGTAGLLVPIGGSPTQAQGAGAADQEITDWIVIAPDGEVTLGLSQPEVGQGSCTVLPQILADELDADWQRVKVRFVTGRDAYKIAFKNEPPVQKEGASMSNTVLYSRLRTAGAQACEVLIRATAGHWNVTPDQCRADTAISAAAPLTCAYARRSMQPHATWRDRDDRPPSHSCWRPGSCRDSDGAAA